jgi:hypothetical protein
MTARREDVLRPPLREWVRGDWLWPLMATAISQYAGYQKARPKLPVAVVERV